MAAIWSEKVQVHVGADAGAPTLGLLSGTADFLRMNTDLAWANRPFIILANNDLIKGVISPYAGLYKMVSDASLVEWGGYSADDALVAYSRADVAGEPDANNVLLETASDAGLYSGATSLRTSAISTGAAGQFISLVDVTSRNATNICQVEAIANSTAGASLLVTLNGAADSEINLQATVTTGLSVDLTGFKAQTFDHAFRINDEDGVVTQFSPFVADGALAFAYLFNTSNTMTNATSGIAQFRNNGTQQLSVSPFGGLFRIESAATLTLWGGYTDQDALVSISRADIAGETNAHVIELAATSNDWIYDGSVFIDANAASTGAAGTYGAQVNVAANNATITTQVLNRVSTAEGAWIDVVGFAAQTNAFNFRISDAGGPVTQFSPFVINGAFAVAYLLDTSNALSNSTASIASIKNNGAQKAFISHQGGYFFVPSADALTLYGGFGNKDVLVGFSRVDEGEPEELQVYLTVTSDSWFYGGEAKLHCGSTIPGGAAGTYTAKMTIAAYNSTTNAAVEAISNTASGATVGITGFVGQAFPEPFNIRDAAGVRLVFNPFVADSATAVAYFCDTSVNLTNAAARIFEWRNAGSVKAAITKDGFFTVAGTKVVGTRVVDARIDDAINSGDATTDGVIDAIRDTLIAHGLCTAA